MNTIPLDMDARNRALRKLFGAVAPAYDSLNHMLSLGLDYLWRRSLVRNLSSIPEGPVLDLAAGTFDLSIILARQYPRHSILAADFCLSMLTKGLPKITKAGLQKSAPPHIIPLNADAYQLPLPDKSVAAVTLAFGLRNMSSRPMVLRELLRVIQPGGRLGILELGSARHKLWGGIYNFYLNRLLPHLAGLFSGERAAYAYLAKSVREFPPAETLAEEICEAGFTNVCYKALSGGIVYIHLADAPHSPCQAA